jgi:hypothetical protein
MAKEKKGNDRHMTDPCDSTIADRLREVTRLAEKSGVNIYGDALPNVETSVTKTYQSGDPNVPDEMRVTVRVKGKEVQSEGVVIDKR